MFEQSGKKIKNLALTLFKVGVSICIVAGGFGFFAGAFAGEFVLCLMSVLLVLCGSVSIWIFCLYLYAFGQLVDNSDTNTQQNSRIIQLLESKSFNKQQTSSNAETPNAKMPDSIFSHLSNDADTKQPND